MLLIAKKMINKVAPTKVTSDIPKLLTIEVEFFMIFIFKLVFIELSLLPFEREARIIQ